LNLPRSEKVYDIEPLQQLHLILEYSSTFFCKDGYEAIQSKLQGKSMTPPRVVAIDCKTFSFDKKNCLLTLSPKSLSVYFSSLSLTPYFYVSLAITLSISLYLCLYLSLSLFLSFSLSFSISISVSVFLPLYIFLSSKMIKCF